MTMTDINAIIPPDRFDWFEAFCADVEEVDVDMVWFVGLNDGIGFVVEGGVGTIWE